MHDKNGAPLDWEDRVALIGTIVDMFPSSTSCNIRVKLDDGSLHYLTADQVVKQEPPQLQARVPSADEVVAALEAVALPAEVDPVEASADAEGQATQADAVAALPSPIVEESAP